MQVPLEAARVGMLWRTIYNYIYGVNRLTHSAWNECRQGLSVRFINDTHCRALSKTANQAINSNGSLECLQFCACYDCNHYKQNVWNTYRAPTHAWFQHVCLVSFVSMLLTQQQQKQHKFTLQPSSSLIIGLRSLDTYSECSGTRSTFNSVGSTKIISSIIPKSYLSPACVEQ